MLDSCYLSVVSCACKNTRWLSHRFLCYLLCRMTFCVLGYVALMIVVFLRVDHMAVTPFFLRSDIDARVEIVNTNSRRITAVKFKYA
jgi:hypothetical protein